MALKVKFTLPIVLTILATSLGLPGILTAGVKPRAPITRGKGDITSGDKLVKAFVRGLTAARKFNTVSHLFLSHTDLDDLLAVMRKADLPKHMRRQIEGPKSKERQRRILVQIDRQIVKRWDSLLEQIRKKNMRVVYVRHKAHAKVGRNKIEYHELDIQFRVEEGNRSRVVSRTLRAMNLGGKLKIVHLFPRI